MLRHDWEIGHITSIRGETSRYRIYIQSGLEKDFYENGNYEFPLDKIVLLRSPCPFDTIISKVSHHM